MEERSDITPTDAETSTITMCKDNDKCINSDPDGDDNTFCCTRDNGENSASTAGNDLEYTQ